MVPATSARRSPTTAGFAERGFPIAALVDIDPDKVGLTLAGVVVRSLDELPDIVATYKIAIGIVATPASAAQSVADRLVAAGVRSILNFAPSVVVVPPAIPLRKVDLATELQILSYYQEHPTGTDRSLAG